VIFKKAGCDFQEKKAISKSFLLHKEHSLLEKGGNVYFFTVNINLHLKGD